MKTYYCNRDSIQLPEELLEKTGLLYRGLGEGAEREFLEHRCQKPKAGEISVGTGVFFSDTLEYARNYAKNIILVTTQNKLAKGKEPIDTRVKGYHILFEEEIKAEKQEYSYFEVEERVQKQDTLSFSPGLHFTIYTARREIKEKDLVAKIVLN